MLLELLKRLAPSTDPKLIERFVPYFELLEPLFGITTTKRRAAFYPTLAYESQYFRKTREGRAKAGTRARKFQDAYWSTGYYGRGLAQVTKQRNYIAFDDWIAKRADVLQLALANNIQIKDFVVHPEQLEHPFWAVVSAFWYWDANNFNKYADKGEFYEIQDLVNTGKLRDGREPLDYPTRSALNQTALQFLSASQPTVRQPQTTISGTISVKPDVIPPGALDSATSASPNPFKKISGGISNLVSWAQGLSERGASVEASVSKSSWASIAFKKILGLFLIVFGFFVQNPVYLVLGVALIIAAAWFLSKAKDRLNNRKIAGL